MTLIMLSIIKWKCVFKKIIRRVASITTDNHFFTEGLRNEFPISFRLLLFVTMWTLTIVFNLRKKNDLCILWPYKMVHRQKLGWWLKIGMFGWKILLPGQGWVGPLGFGDKASPHRSICLSSWSRMKDVSRNDALYLQETERGKKKGFIFWLTAFDSGYFLSKQTDS